MSRINHSVAALVFLVFTVCIFTPKVHADVAACQSAGYTVVYVNGILTTREQADIDQEALGKKFKDRTGRTDVTFLTGYNQTHVGGLGDKLKSVAQTYLTADGSSIDDYDLKTILMQIAPQMHTQKILLVGHSQGTFYTNAMYDYLVQHGVSPAAITVYNLATPAARVAGGGAYTTSSYDKVINYVRELDAKSNAPQPLPANINIPIPYSEKDDEWAGHHFQPDYLEGAPGQIVRDMQTLLGSLQSNEPDVLGPCFDAPQDTLAYKATALAYGALDSTVRGTQDAGSAIAGAAQSMQSAVGNALSSAWYSVVPRPSLDAAFAAMHVVGATGGTGVDFQSETWKEYEADAKAEAAAAAARAAAQEEALRNAPRVEAFKPKAEQISQAGAAALAFTDPIQPQEEPVAGDPVPATDPIIPQQQLVEVTPGFGGGGGGGASTGSSASTPAASSAPAAPVLVSPDLTVDSPETDSTFATTSVSFTGTATLDATITASGDANGSTTTDSSGNWTITLILPTGTSTISFIATKNGLDSSSVDRTIGIAAAAPGVPVVSAAACVHSISVSACVLPTTQTILSWDNADNAESYDVYADGVFVSNVTGTSTLVTLAADTTTVFRVVALNVLGDTATSSDLAVASLSFPLRINEIAWSGTVSNPSDQWLELRSNVSSELDLSSFALTSESSAFYVPLAGALAAHDDVFHTGYYLIEPREQATSAHADLVYAFAPLSAGGEELHLVWFDGSATTTIDSTPVVGTCSGWCAGSAVHQLGTTAQGGISPVWATESMERIGEGGSSASSWQTNDTYNLTIRDSGSMFVYGTPRLKNSEGWPQEGWVCDGTVYAPSDTPTFAAPQSCTVLMRFISTAANRYVGYFTGTVGSSALVTASALGKAYQTGVTLDGGGMASGDSGFVAVWENRTNVSTDVQGFEDYLTGVTADPPHSNYIVLPWVLQ